MAEEILGVGVQPEFLPPTGQEGVLAAARELEETLAGVLTSIGESTRKINFAAMFEGFTGTAQEFVSMSREAVVALNELALAHERLQATGGGTPNTLTLGLASVASARDVQSVLEGARTAAADLSEQLAKVPTRLAEATQQAERFRAATAGNALGLGMVESNDALANFRTEEEGVNLPAATAASTRVLSEAATAQYLKTAANPDADDITRMRQEGLAGRAAIAQERAAQAAAFATPEAAAARRAEAEAKVAGASDAEAVAQGRLAAAQERAQRVMADNTATTEQMIRALTAEASARRSLTSLTEGQVATEGDGRGFVGEFIHGFIGGGRGGRHGRVIAGGAGGGEGGAGEFAAMSGAIARYTIMWQLFRGIETTIRDSITETVQFERAVSQLSYVFGTTRDNVQGIADTLGQISSQAGLGPSAGVLFGAQYAAHFSGQGSPAMLAQIGATLGSQMAIVGGVDAQQAQEQLGQASALATAFNLNGTSGTQRILDAAATMARTYGLATPNDLLAGMGQIADVAQQGGFTPEQASALMADVMNRTGMSSSAAGGELARFFGREGSSPFQKVFSEYGVRTDQPFAQELGQFSQIYAHLGASARSSIFSELGGGRAGAAAVAVLEDFGKATSTANAALENGGAYAQTYDQRLHDLKGILDQIRGAFQELAKDIGTSGLLDVFGLALMSAKPLLQTLDDIVQAFNAIPGHQLIMGTAEIAGLAYGASRLAGGGVLTGVGSAVGGVLGRGGERVPVDLSAIGGTTVLTTGMPGTLPTYAADAGAAAGGEVTAAAGLDEAIAAVVAAEEQQVITSQVAVQALAALTAAAEDAAVALEANAEVQATVSDATMATIVEGGAGFAALRNAGATGAAETEAGLLAGVRGLAGRSVGLLGMAGGALAAGVLVDNQYNAYSSELAAKNAAENFNLTGTTVGALDAQQSRAGQLAQQAQASSAGLLGSIMNAGAWFGEHSGLSGLVSHIFGTTSDLQTTGEAAARARQLSHIAGLEAERIQAAQAAAPGNVSGAAALVDLSNSAQLTGSLKALSARGMDAGQTLDALITRLNDFASASSGAANMLTEGQDKILAAQAAAGATNTLTQEFGKAGRSINFGSIDQTIQNALNHAFGAEGLNSGGAITAKEARDAAASAISAVQGNLVHQYETQGMSRTAAEAAARRHLGDVSLAIRQATEQHAADINAARGQKIPVGEIGTVESDATSLITQAATEAQNQARITGDLMSQGVGGADPGVAALAGARAALSRAQSLYTALKASGASAQSLQPLADQIRALQTNVLSDTEANVTALGQLAAAQAGPFNQAGAIQAQLNAVNANLKTDPHNVQLQIQQANLIGQQQQQHSAALTSTFAAAANPLSPLDVAQKAAEGAAANLRYLRSIGATGEALNSAERSARQAAAAYLQAQVTNANDLATASVAIGDSASAGMAAWQKAMDAASIAVDPGAQAMALQQAAAGWLQYLNGLTTQATLTEKLASDTTDPVAMAITAMNNAAGVLANDLATNKKYPGSVSQEQINKDQLTLTQDTWSKQKAAFDQNMQMQQAMFDSRRESAATYIQFLERSQGTLQHQLAGMHKGQQGYQQLVDELNQVDQSLYNTQIQAAGQFNLGNIKLPTPYEARREVQAQSQHVNYQDNTVVNVNVNGADVGQVKTLLSSLMGPNAQFPRSGTIGRKVY